MGLMSVRRQHFTSSALTCGPDLSDFLSNSVKLVDFGFKLNTGTKLQKACFLLNV
jgi:hypothetical protein